MSLLDIIVGHKNDPAALAAGIEQYITEQIATVNANTTALLTQINADAAAREAQLLAGMKQTVDEIQAIVAPFADLVQRLDGAKITSVVELGPGK
jgi:predicted phage-related endonuclease